MKIIIKNNVKALININLKMNRFKMIYKILQKNNNKNFKIYFLNNNNNRLIFRNKIL